MSLIIKNTLSRKEWEYSEEGWVLKNGLSDQRVSDGKVTNFNCGIYKLVENEQPSEQYAGNANGFLDNDTLKININGVPASELAEVSAVVENMVGALEGVDI